MGKEKDSFLMYYEWEDSFSGLSNQQLGELVRAVYAYERRGEEYAGTDQSVRMAMSFIRPALERNKSRYERVCERNRQNIAKRWGDSKHTTGKTGIPNDTKDTDRDRERDRDRDRDRERDRDAPAPSAHTPPTREAVEQFAQENHLALDVDRFWRYYEARRWLTQNGRPINWQERAKRWARRDRKEAQEQAQREAQKRQEISQDFAAMQRLLAQMKGEDGEM